MPRPGPLDRVRQLLRDQLEPDALARLPRNYFRVGDVLLLDLPVPGPESDVAAAYAEALDRRSVLGREGHIEGELRLPRTRLLWGDPDTETVHVENGIRYRLDPARVMWSPGNLPERQRMARLDAQGETVVDLCAGVGYFSLPILVKANAARVVAIEKNPVSHAYLRANADQNGVGDRMEAVLGDCRDVAPRGVADRVLMGYLPDSLEFLPSAVAAVRPEGGVLHVHRVVSRGKVTDGGFAEVAQRVADVGGRAQLLGVQRVKSFATRRDHVVLDVRVTP